MAASLGGVFLWEFWLLFESDVKGGGGTAANGEVLTDAGAMVGVELAPACCWGRADPFKSL